MTARCVGRIWSRKITGLLRSWLAATPKTRSRLRTFLSLDRRLISRSFCMRYLKPMCCFRGKFTLCDSTYPTWERIERQAGQPKERKMLCLRCPGQPEGILGSHHRQKNARGDVFLRRHKPQFRVSFAGIGSQRAWEQASASQYSQRENFQRTCRLKIARGPSDHRPPQEYQRQPHRTFAASSAGSTSD